MRHIQITTKTYRDNSARSIDLPTILIVHDGDTQVLMNSSKKHIHLLGINLI